MKYISAEGLEQLKKELEELKRKRQEIARRLEEAKGLGDLAENTEYMEAKEAQAFNEGKIVELTEIIKNIIVIDRVKEKDIIQIGSAIKVSSEGKNYHFVIVGSEEAAPSFGKISNESPLGKAFLGRKVGEEVEIETPNGKVKYKILAIE